MYDRINNVEEENPAPPNTLDRTLIELEKEAAIIDTRIQNLSTSPLFETTKIAGTLFTASLFVFFVAKQIPRVSF